MKSIGFYFNRIKSISLRELLLYRTYQFINQNVKLKYFVNKDFSKIKSVNNNLVSWKSTAIDFDSNYDIFEKVSVNLYGEIDWLSDPLTGKRHSLMYFTLYNKQNYELYGDVKYLSDIGRFHFLPFMALDYANNGSTVSLDYIEKHVSNFSKNVKFLHSIHWTSGIEIAIRNINFTYTLLILEKADCKEANLIKELKELIVKGVTFIKNNLSLYSSANNHLLAELCALAMYNLIFEKQSKYIRMFLKEVDSQFNEDGVNFELSTGYHAEALDYAVVVISMIKHMGRDLEFEIHKLRHKLIAAGSFLFHCEAFGPSHFGDCDDGHLIYPFMDKKFDYHQSILQSVDILYKTRYCKEFDIDSRNFLIFGDNVDSEVLEKEAEEPNDIVFDDSGYIFLYDKPNSAKFTFDFGAIGDNLLSAHGHSDQLAFTLTINGEPVIVDNGTFQYHERYKDLRNYFRGIYAHNTIAVNGENHAKILTRMSWTKTNKAILHKYENKNNVVTISASSNLFEKRFGIIIVRNIEYNKDDSNIFIFDEIINVEGKEVVIDSILNINPSLKQIKKANNKLVLENGVVIEVLNKRDELSYFSGNLNPILGWYSDKFEHKLEGVTVINKFKTAENRKSGYKITY